LIIFQALNPMTTFNMLTSNCFYLFNNLAFE